jgi:hypothetical protein
VLFIYHLIPGKFDFLGWFAALGTTPISRFWGLLVAFPVAYNMKMFVSGHQSIHTHCIVMPVKFDGGLSISFLRNKQLLKKKEAKRSHFQELIFLIFKPRYLEKRQTLEKVLLFWRSFFL